MKQKRIYKRFAYTPKNLVRGFSTLEIIISLFIFSVVMSSLITTSFGGQSLLSSSLAFQEILPKTKAEIKNAFLFFQDDFSGAFEPQNDEILIEESLIDDFTKKITASSQNHLAEAELFSFVTNWKESVGGDTCFRKLSGVESYSVKNELPLSETSATDIDVVRGKAYITIDSSSAPNFLIVDVSDKDNPEFIPHNFSLNRKPKAIHIAGKHAFVTTEVSVAHPEIFWVIDILNSQNPEIVAGLEIENSGNGSSIFHKDKKVYLGTTKSSIEEFHIIDALTPSNPQLIGSWESSAKINNIFTINDFVFVAATNTVPFKMLDAENPQNILLIDDYETDGNSKHGVRALAVINNFLVGGRSALSINENYHELFVFDISEGNLDFVDSKHIGNSVKDLIARENVLVLAAAHAHSRNIIEFRSLEENNMLDLLHEISLEEIPVAIDCEEDILYVVTESPSKLIIIAPEE